MRRREVIAALLLGAADAHGQARIRSRPRVGLLDPGIPHLFDAFREGMRALGYVDGQNMIFVLASADGRPDAVPHLAAELLQQDVDVVVTAGTLAVRSVAQATSAVPVVFAALGDAIGSRTVRSLSRPGGNLTGLSFLNTEISAKRIEMLVEILPGLKRLAVLVDPNAPGVFLDATREAAEPLGIELSVVDVGRVEAIEPAFARAVSERSDALNVLASAFFNSQRARLAEPAAVHRLPAMYETGEYVRAGGLIAYGPDLAEMFRRAAIYVDKIFKGASPADLPVEQPTKFELMINLKTSQSFGPHDPAHAPRPSPRGDRMRLAD